MNPKYKIVPDLQAQNSLTIHPNTAKYHKLAFSKKWFIRFGIQAVEINLKQSSMILENEVKLPIGIIESLRIPLSGRYEIRQDGNELLIGPYIGLLTTSKKSSLDESVQFLSNYFYEYENLGGAIAAFSLEGMDPHEYTIEGYMYNPETKGWDKGVYSYPAAVFKTIFLNKKWRNHFQTIFGNRLFNSYVFNKWEMYKWLSQISLLKPHLSETILYKKREDLEFLLDIHQQIYVKPIQGSMGERIFKVTKMVGTSLKLEYQQGGLPYEKEFSNLFDLDDFFKSEFNGKKYLLQRAIDLISIEGKKIDFRIIMVKDQAGIWNDLCMVAKYGQKKSIVTNILAGGTAEIGEITLKKIFGLSSEEVNTWRKEISNITYEAVQRIEQCGVHCGNLGIDIAIDNERQMWIIEINNLNPSPLFALDINDRTLFYKIKSMNLLYAKKLAGFPKDLV